MKIVQLAYALTSGGGERFVVDLSNTLAENPDNDVTIVITNSDQIPGNIHYLPDISNRVKFVSLKCKSGFSLKAFWRVFRYICKERPDVVHAHCNMLQLYLSVLLCRKPKYVHTLHSLASYSLQFKWLKLFNKCFYKNKVQGITISEECHEDFLKVYGRSNDILITNGRTSPALTDRYDEVKREAESFKSSPSTPIFIHVARCHPVKNQQLLFSAFEQMDREGRDFQLIVLGAGYENEWIPKYKNHCNIHILGEKTNVGDYVSCADFFVLTSKIEGLPLTLLEAMSKGVIPVCTPAGGIKNVIRDGENGYMSKTVELEDYILTLRRVFEAEHKVSRDAIMAEYESKYSMKICAEKYYQVYKRLLGYT